MKLQRRYRDGVVTGVRILHAGPKQHFSPRVIERGVAEGWLSLSQGRIVITAEAGAAVYRIVSPPGYYCCHCQAPLGDSPSAQAHVASAHPGAASPDPCNPAGYRRDNFYACVRQE